MPARQRAGALVAAAVAALAIAPPAAAQDALPRAGESLGGNWRDAPTIEGRRLGGLTEGTPLTILENAGTRLDGFDWFAVEVNGRRGYQWGGILCADGVAVPGLRGVCPGTRAARPAPEDAGPPAPAAVRRATADLDGEWTRVRADVYGLRPGSCLPGSDAVVTVREGRILFHEATCTLEEARPEAGGLRLVGSCTGEGETRPFDRLAFLGRGGGLLALVDRTGEDADLAVYRGCWLPE